MEEKEKPAPGRSDTPRTAAAAKVLHGFRLLISSFIRALPGSPAADGKNRPSPADAVADSPSMDQVEKPLSRGCFCRKLGCPGRPQPRAAGAVDTTFRKVEKVVSRVDTTFRKVEKVVSARTNRQLCRALGGLKHSVTYAVDLFQHGPWGKFVGRRRALPLSYGSSFASACVAAGRRAPLL